MTRSGIDGARQRQRQSGRDENPGGRLRIHLFGGFRVVVDEVAVDDATWRLHKARNLVKLLAVANGHRLTREQVIDLLWPDLDPDAGANNLYRTLHAARRALARGKDDPSDNVIHLRSGMLELRPPGELWIDVEAFESAAQLARHSTDPAAYRKAIELYEGDLLPADRYEDWAARRRDTLRETYLQLLLSLARLEEQQGALLPAMEALTKLVEVEPAFEEAHVGLMRLYARTGQRHQALRQYQHLRDALQQELDISPDPTSHRLYAEILAGRYPSPDVRPERASSTPATNPPHNLPVPLTRFIGRKLELAEVRARLGTVRLLTLTGIGGVGKTRLAVEVARAALDDYPDGVWLVELAGLSSPALVPGAVSTVLGLREEPRRSRLETLASALHSKSALLVLDNCEHLIEACAELATELLGRCPRLRILATSREPLHVPSEMAWRVLSLHLPDPRMPAELVPPPDEQSESVRLFLDRARLARPGFVLTKQNAAAVRQICRRLDGIPLALELAATWISVLPPEQLAARLDGALALLTSGRPSTPGRHQTMRATLDWSYQLLEPAEQLLLRRLAVFAGGWTLEAAEAVCAGIGDDNEQADVLPLLARLADKSLAQVEERTLAGSRALDVRYRLLEVVRQYAVELLEASGEADPIRGQHAEHYLALTRDVETALAGPGQVACLERLEREHGNIQAALHWLAERGDIERQASLCAGIFRFWQIRGHLAEGSQWLESILSNDSAASIPPLLRAKLLRGAGVLAESRGDPTRAVGLLRDALELLRPRDDPRSLAITLRELGTALQRQGRFDESAQLYEESLRLSEAIGDSQGVADTLLQLGNVVRYQDDHDRAITLYERSLRLQGRLGNKRGAAMALGSLGVIASHSQEYARADVLYTEALRLFEELGDKRFSATTLNNLAVVAYSLNQQDRGARFAARSFEFARETGDMSALAFSLEALARGAALAGDGQCAGRLLGTAENVRTVMNLPRPPVNSFTRHLEEVRAHVDEALFTAGWDVGRTLTLEDALSEAEIVAASFSSSSSSGG